MLSRSASAVLALTVTLFAALLPPDNARAARDWVERETAKAPITAPRESGLEILMFEVENCVYCGVFKRDVLPLYKQGPQAAVAPIRFVDLNRVDLDKLNLRGGLTVVPTFVLMKDGQEVERITGYTGPTNFIKLVQHMVPLAD